MYEDEFREMKVNADRRAQFYVAEASQNITWNYLNVLYMTYLLLGWFEGGLQMIKCGVFSLRDTVLALPCAVNYT